MKTKIIAVVVSIVIIAGVGTAVGVTVSKSNDKETESLVNEAVSNALASALATEESTAEESTTEESTTEDSSKPSSSQSSSSPKNNAPSQTKASTATATEQQTVATGHKIKNDSKKDSCIKNDSPEEDDLMEYKNAIINGETVLTYSIISGPNAGKFCYYNNNNELVYIDDISKIEFVKPQIPEIPEWD